MWATQSSGGEREGGEVGGREGREEGERERREGGKGGGEEEGREEGREEKKDIYTIGYCDVLSVSHLHMHTTKEGNTHN